MDIFIATLVYTVQSAVAALAVYVTIYPLADHQIKHKKAALWAIGVLWILGLGITALQQHRSAQAQAALEGRLDQIEHNTKEPPSVNVLVPPTPVPSPRAWVTADMVFSPDGIPPFSTTHPFTVNVLWGNGSSVPAHDFIHWEGLAFHRGRMTPQDEDANYQKYKASRTRVNTLPAIDSGIGPGQAVYSTLTAKIENVQTAEALVSGGLVIYVFGLGKYTDERGEQETQLCGYYYGNSTGVHLCYSHNGPK